MDPFTKSSRPLMFNDEVRYLRYTFATPEIVAGASKELRKDQLRMLTKDEVDETSQSRKS